MDFLTIAEEYKKAFFEDREGFLLQIGKYPSIRDILCQVYLELIKRGECQPIEKLPPKDKLEIWNEAKRISSIQERNYLIQVAKAIHGLGQYLQL